MVEYRGGVAHTALELRFKCRSWISGNMAFRLGVAMAVKNPSMRRFCTCDWLLMRSSR